MGSRTVPDRDCRHDVHDPGSRYSGNGRPCRVSDRIPAFATGLSIILLAICAIIIYFGRYPLLDSLVKVIIIILSISTMIAVIAALFNTGAVKAHPAQLVLWNLSGVTFMVALIGWMPSAIDISVWHSIWTLERIKQTGHHPSLKEFKFDFNLGYIGTAFFALMFMTLGALVMHNSGETFAKTGGGFARQLLTMYTSSLGSWSAPIIGAAAFTTMFSTTLTCLDAFPRVLSRTIRLLRNEEETVKRGLQGDALHWVTLLVVVSGALILLGVFGRQMTFMVDLATILSFLTAPILSYFNYRVITGKNVPPDAQPGTGMKILSWIGLSFATLFALTYLIWRFVLRS